MTKNPQQIDRLAEWLNLKKREKRLSFPKIAELSGGLVSQGTPSNIVKKRHKNVDARTVKGLAKAFEITEQELWDIVNGVVGIEKSSIEAREVMLPAYLWRKIDDESRRARRSWNQHLEAVIAAYFGDDVNIDLKKIA
jgi:transcriptional regulator with XRE-family HTH domain